MKQQTRRRLRIRYSNHIKCLLCYLLAFSVPLLIQAAGILQVYPYRLAGTAPDVAAALTEQWPALEQLLQKGTERAREDSAENKENRVFYEQWQDVLHSAQREWLMYIACSALGAWFLTLLIQLLWRITHGSGLMAANMVRGAVRSMRRLMLLILLLNAAFAFGIWYFGLGYVPGKTVWDYLSCLPVYPLNVAAAWVVFRYAAPPVLSSGSGYFKRL